MMTAVEMEEVLKNLDRRLPNVEQILPTLATKEDLKEAFSEAKRHAVMLFERTQEQLGVLAEHLGDISRRLPPRR